MLKGIDPIHLRLLFIEYQASPGDQPDMSTPRAHRIRSSFVQGDQRDTSPSRSQRPSSPTRATLASGANDHIVLQVRREHHPLALHRLFLGPSRTFQKAASVSLRRTGISSLAPSHPARPPTAVPFADHPGLSPGPRTQRTGRSPAPVHSLYHRL